MFHSLKGRFLLVQDGISISIRGFKAKERQVDNVYVSAINYHAGTEIVVKNEQEWKEIHALFEENANLAEAVDKMVNEVHKNMHCQLNYVQDVTNFLGSIPKFSKKIETISNTLESVQKMAEEAEKALVIFEDIVETEEYKQKGTNENFAFSEYCNKKGREVDALKKKLEVEYFEKITFEENKIKDVLKERQELFNMAFQQDLQLYKESGIVPNFRINKETSSSVLMLEDIVIEDDLKDLNELLES